MLKQVLNKNASRYFHGLNGQCISFHVHKFENAGCSYTIKNTSKLNQYKTCSIFLLISIINIVNVAFNFFAIGYSIVVYFFTMICIIKTIRTVKRETLLLVPGLGYQIDTWFTYSHSTEFLPWDYVSDIFVNEVISRHRVIFVLTILTKDEKLIPLFQGNHPKLDLIELIYRKINKLKL